MNFKSKILCSFDDLNSNILYRYARFNALNDGERFIKDLGQNLKKNIVFNATLKVRTSTGE